MGRDSCELCIHAFAQSIKNLGEGKSGKEFFESKDIDRRKIEFIGEINILNSYWANLSKDKGAKLLGLKDDTYDSQVAVRMSCVRW